MAMVDTVYWLPIQAGLLLKPGVWSKGLRPPGTVLHSLREVSELSQWLCHEDTTMNNNIVIAIIIIEVVVFTGRYVNSWHCRRL